MWIFHWLEVTGQTAKAWNERYSTFSFALWFPSSNLRYVSDIEISLILMCSTFTGGKCLNVGAKPRLVWVSEITGGGDKSRMNHH